MEIANSARYLRVDGKNEAKWELQKNSGALPALASDSSVIGRFGRGLSFWNMLAVAQIAEGSTVLEPLWKSRFVRC